MKYLNVKVFLINTKKARVTILSCLKNYSSIQIDIRKILYASISYNPVYFIHNFCNATEYIWARGAFKYMLTSKCKYCTDWLVNKSI